MIKDEKIKNDYSLNYQTNHNLCPNITIKNVTVSIKNKDNPTKKTNWNQK